jgi:hypothetical protein
MNASEFIFPFGSVKYSLPEGEIADIIEMLPRELEVLMDGVLEIRFRTLNVEKLYSHIFNKFLTILQRFDSIIRAPIT